MTGAERAWVGWAERLGEKLLGRKVKATLVDAPGWPFMGTYGPGKLTINRSSFGHGFASPTGEASESYLDFLIHEFSHEYGKHMTEEFDGALSRLGAATVRLALEHSGFFTVSDK